MVWSAPSESKSAASERSGVESWGIAADSQEVSQTLPIDAPEPKVARPEAEAAVTRPSQEAASHSHRSASRSRSPAKTAKAHSSRPRRHDTVQLSSSRRLPKPEFTHGTEWWAAPLWQAVESLAAKMPPAPARAMKVESFCSGMCTEAFGLKAQGMIKQMHTVSISRA